MIVNPLKSKQPNPQGKGSVRVLADIYQAAPIYVRQKTARQWLADYFTSLLVLGSVFKFKPIVGNDYYLYFSDNNWKLSLIEPREWNNERFGTYFGKCILHDDRSWSVEPAENWELNTEVVEQIENLQREFLNSINSDQALVDTLPFFSMHLAYYQRLGANALARSLQLSLEMKVDESEMQKISGKQLLVEALEADTPLISNKLLF